MAVNKANAASVVKKNSESRRTTDAGVLVLLPYRVTDKN